MFVMDGWSLFQYIPYIMRKSSYDAMKFLCIHILPFVFFFIVTVVTLEVGKCTLTLHYYGFKVTYIKFCEPNFKWEHEDTCGKQQQPLAGFSTTYSKITFDINLKFSYCSFQILDAEKEDEYNSG